MCLCECMSHVLGCPEEAVGFSEAEVTGLCELQAWVLEPELRSSAKAARTLTTESSVYLHSSSSSSSSFLKQGQKLHLRKANDLPPPIT